MRKYILMSVMLLVASLCYVGAYAAEELADDEAGIVINDEQTSMKAYSMDDTVYLPIRAVCEALGYNVGWKVESGIASIFIIKANDNILLDITDQKIIDNGHEYYMYVNYNGDGYIVHDGKGYLEAGLFSDLFPVNVEYNKEAKQVELKTITENDLSITTKKKDVDRKDIVINLQYPQIEGLNDNSVQDKINSVFEKAATEAEKEGLKNAAELADSGYGGSNRYGTDLNYRIKYNQQGLLSVILYEYQYAGGAHGSTTQSSYTFDLKTGEMLALSDLLNENTKYTTYVNSFIRNEIDKRIVLGDLVELTEFMSVGENPPYYLSNDSIVFYFQQYEYFPYAAGIQEFPVKFSVLKDKFMKGYEFLYNEPVSLRPSKDNILSVGDLGRVVLKGNPTTGYDWHYAIEDDDILKLNSQSYLPNSDAMGSGGTYVWNFKALKAGKTTITFKYYREWEGEASAKSEDVVVYTVIVP